MKTLFQSLIGFILLLSATTLHAQVTGIEPIASDEGGPDSKTVCFTVNIEPSRDISPGWEIAQPCMQNIVKVRIRNNGNCSFPAIRVYPLPHSQGVSFSVYSPGMRFNRAHCAPDPILIQQPLMNNGTMEFTLFADRVSDFAIESICRETREQCQVSVHIQAFPESNLNSQPQGVAPQHPTEPTPPTTTSGTEQSTGITTTKF